ncbi:MAG: hypothetical protein R3F23_04015 [Verrucomicrobiia bacterium]
MEPGSNNQLLSTADGMFLAQLHPVSWYYFIGRECRKEAAEFSTIFLETPAERLTKARGLLHEYRSSAKDSFRDMDHAGVDFKKFQDGMFRIYSDLEKDMNSLWRKAEIIYGEAIETRKAAEKILAMPDSPATAQKAYETALAAEEVAREQLDNIFRFQGELQGLGELTMLSPESHVVTPHNLKPIEDSLMALEGKLNALKETAHSFDQATQVSQEAAGNLVGRKVVLAGVVGASFQAREPREHPLSPTAVGQSVVKAAAEVGGYVLDVAEKADCVVTLGGCYAIDAVMDKAILPAVEAVVPPVAKHVVIPVVEAGISVAQKTNEVAAPVVNEVAAQVNEHVVKPVTDKLTKAFETPAKIADDVTKSSQPKPWGISVHW